MELQTQQHFILLSRAVEVIKMPKALVCDNAQQISS